MIVKQENPLYAGLAGLSVGPVSLLIFAFFKHVSPWSLLENSSHLPFFIPLAFIMLRGLFDFTRIPRWRRLKRLRQAAAQGDATIPLAVTRIPASEHSFHLPLQIIPKQNWLPIVLLSCFLVWAGNFWVFPDLLAMGDWGLALFMEILLGSCALALLYHPLKRRRIEATTERLIVGKSALWRPSSSQKEHEIRWDDARLFAIYGGKPGEPGTRYELAGADVSVEWRDYRQQRWWLLQRADERYAEQMEMLLAYISARTGLPLYDLR